MSKISGPLLDRIDIHIAVPAVRYQDLNAPGNAESSEEIKRRIETVRTIQRSRLKGEKSVFYNAAMNTKQVNRYCLLDYEAKNLLKMAMTELNFSARAYDKVLRVAKTIADLDGKETITAGHISEAIGYRSLETINP